VAKKATFLRNVFGAELLMYMVGASTEQILRLEDGLLDETYAPYMQRLHVVWEFVELLRPHYDPPGVRAWFTNENEQLSDKSPAQAIHEGRLEQTKAVAHAFVVSG
jgi:hypothetical protein